MKPIYRHTLVNSLLIFTCSNALAETLLCSITSSEFYSGDLYSENTPSTSLNISGEQNETTKKTYISINKDNTVEYKVIKNDTEFAKEIFEQVKHPTFTWPTFVPSLPPEQLKGDLQKVLVQIPNTNQWRLHARSRTIIPNVILANTVHYTCNKE